MIRGVAFDWAGVLTPTPLSGMAGYEASVGLPPGALVGYLRGHDYMHRLETAEITPREFWKLVGTEISEAHGVTVSPREAMAAEEAVLVLRPEAVDVVTEVRAASRKTAVVTNNVRGGAWRDGFPVALFDVILDSSEVGLRKPDIRLFQLLLERLELPANEVVFIDDFAENLPEAKELGITVRHLARPEDLRDVLVDCGVLA